MCARKANKQYTGEFKLKVIEHMREEGFGYRETARHYEINDHKRIIAWERIYLEEGADGLSMDRRGRTKSPKRGRPPKLEKQTEEDLIAENQRLRAEVDYLKKLSALVQQR
ncbi:helix-turn-helix domain-containing protein [Anaerospora hongkongensis]|uniref:helix-turn-helix domain-containing protein n=1 Tax=Anaerospora hongkongensis TaxID=244830 RepID=UPI00289CA558|nr:helix-turn-helix domain-containing protein [Anaerospora hongkongensis]